MPGEFFDVNPGKRRSGRPSRFRNYVRFSFGPEEKAVEEGVRRIHELVRSKKREGGVEPSPFLLPTSRLPDLLGQPRHDLEQVAHDAVVGHLEDRRVLVLVDGDDGLRRCACRPGAGWRRRCPPRRRGPGSPSGRSARSGSDGRRQPSSITARVAPTAALPNASASSSTSAKLAGVAEPAAAAHDDRRVGQVELARRPCRRPR